MKKSKKISFYNWVVYLSKKWSWPKRLRIYTKIGKYPNKHVFYLWFRIKWEKDITEDYTCQTAEEWLKIEISYFTEREIQWFQRERKGEWFCD